MILAEEWHYVRGYEGAYKVSSLGNVVSCARYIPCGEGRRWVGQKSLARTVGGRAKNYFRVMLEAGGKKRNAYVHTLVCEAFHGPRPDGLFACHKNDKGMDNREVNLYWGTREDNENDRSIQGFVGEEAPF